MGQKQISSKIFGKISSLVYNNIGVNLSDKKRVMVNSRLSKRVYQLELGGFEEYYRYLLDNENEFIVLYNLITTNVTYFFREDHHFELLEKTLLGQLKSSGTKKIRVWSSACSTGEEPYTAAITLKEFFGSGYDLKVLATDINTEVLEMAKKGIYTDEQVKKVPYPLVKKYFKMGQGQNKGLFKVKDSIRDLVLFNRLNLNSKSPYPIKSKLDIIFCRNVFIYFDNQTRAKILNRFHDILKDDGILFLGHSESIPLEDRAKWENIGKTTYRKVKMVR